MLRALRFTMPLENWKGKEVAFRFPFRLASNHTTVRKLSYQRERNARKPIVSYPESEIPESRGVLKTPLTNSQDDSPVLERRNEEMDESSRASHPFPELVRREVTFCTRSYPRIEREQLCCERVQLIARMFRHDPGFLKKVSDR